MKLTRKQIIYIIVIICVILAGFFIWGNKKEKKEKTIQNQEETINTEKYAEILKNGTKINKSDKLKQTKLINGLEIMNIQLIHRNGISTILADVKNTMAIDINLMPIKLILLDEQENILEEIEGIISPVKAGNTVQLNIGASKDYANAYDFRIEER